MICPTEWSGNGICGWYLPSCHLGHCSSVTWKEAIFTHGIWEVTRWMELKKPAVSYLPYFLQYGTTVAREETAWLKVGLGVRVLGWGSLGLSLQCWQKVQLGLPSSVFSKSHTWNDQIVLLSSKKPLSILSKIWYHHPHWLTVTYGIFSHRINVIHVVNWIL